MLLNRLTKLLLAGAASCIGMAASAQRDVVLSSNIASLQVTAGNNWLSMPIINLNDGNPINICFDDLTHDYHRYAYKLQHCEADWSPSEGIIDTDYCDGFVDGDVIDSYAKSVNTNTIYTHYELSIPNERCRLKMSGNYRLAIYDDNDKDTILYAHFMVVDPAVKITVEVSSNTDIDANATHQQVSGSVDFSGLRISNPAKEITTIVIQNGVWSTARYNTKPQAMLTNKMIFSHNRELIFDGGNEYRKFEILDVERPSMGVESTYWDGANYCADLWIDEPRRNYLYDEDANGHFYIRNRDNVENDIASDYVNVKFTLSTPRQTTPVYINGIWTNIMGEHGIKMEYNNEAKQYEACAILKQGYYSYRYVTTSLDEARTIPLPCEGNFHQTENEYQILVYFRQFGQRTDQLVGYKNIKTR